MDIEIRNRLTAWIEMSYPAFFILFAFSVSFLKPVAVGSMVLLLVFFPLQILLGGKLRRVNRWYSLSALQYIFVIALSLAYTYDMDFGSRAIRFGSIALISVILAEKLASRDMARRILHAYIAGGAVLSLIIIYEGIVKHVVRPSHVWMGVHAGNLLLLSLVTAVSLLLGADFARRKVVYVVAIAVHLFAFYLNGTRGAWIALAFILVCIPFVALEMRALWKFAYIAVLLLAITFVTRGTFFQTKLHEAVTDVSQYKEGISETSLGGRFEMWKASSRMFREHPLIGVGAGDWVSEFRKSARQSKASAFLMQFNQPHSIYLEALSTRGLMGFASLLMFICYPAVYVWRRKSSETAVFRNLILFTVFAMLISGLTDTLTNVRFVFMAYCILIGAGMSAFAGPDIDERTVHDV